MKLMDIDSDTLGIPETDYDARVTMPASEFSRIVKDLASLGESVRIEQLVILWEPKDCESNGTSQRTVHDSAVAAFKNEGPRIQPAFLRMRLRMPAAESSTAI